MRTNSTTECPGGKRGGAQTPASADGGVMRARLPVPERAVGRAGIPAHMCAQQFSTEPEGDRPEPKRVRQVGKANVVLRHRAGHTGHRCQAATFGIPIGDSAFPMHSHAGVPRIPYLYHESVKTIQLHTAPAAAATPARCNQWACALSSFHFRCCMPVRNRPAPHLGGRCALTLCPDLVRVVAACCPLLLLLLLCNVACEY